MSGARISEVNEAGELLVSAEMGKETRGMGGSGADFDAKRQKIHRRKNKKKGGALNKKYMSSKIEERSGGC